MAGLAGPSTDAAVRQARDFRAAGADALLVFPIPAYLSSPLNPAVPVAYHTAIAEVGLPLILFQLQPALAGVNFENDVLQAMAEVDGVVAIKEASFDARRFVDTARLLEQLPKKITLLTGNDNFILESFLLGATGALIGFGAVMTREQVDMIRAWQEGRTRRRDGPRAPRPAARRRRVRGAGRRLPRPSQGMPPDPRRARGRPRPPPAAPDLGRRSVPTSRTSSRRSACCASRSAPAGSTDGDRTC